jgi:hypothetical protein
MFCAKCGSNIKDDATFCPNCGHSVKLDTKTIAQQPNENSAIPNQTVIYAGNVYSSEINTRPKRNFPLLNLAGKLFYPFFEVGLWLVLVIGAIGGGIIGGYSNENSPELGAILGVIIGVIIAFILNIICGGLVSIFLKMNDNIEKIIKNE